MDAYRTPPSRARSPRLRSLQRAGRLAALGLGVGFGAGLAALTLQLATPHTLPPAECLPSEILPQLQVSAPAAPPAPSSEAVPTPPEMTPEQAQATLAREANAVIHALRARDTRALGAMIDPDVGLELGPSGELGHERRALKRQEIAECFRDRRLRFWGSHDGSGDDITLTCAAYWEQYVYDRDFASAANVAYNEHPDYGHGFSRSFTPQPQEAYVEYYLPGETDLSRRGVALILVFSPIGNAWKLTGLAHAEAPLPSEEE